MKINVKRLSSERLDRFRGRRISGCRIIQGFVDLITGFTEIFCLSNSWITDSAFQIRQTITFIVSRSIDFIY